MAHTIKLKRGLEADRVNVLPESGEIIVTTDENLLYIGDGTTIGGTSLGYLTPDPTTKDVEIVGSNLFVPETFTIDPSPYSNIGGTVIINGNLQVNGTNTIINSTTLDVEDLNITLAKGTTDAVSSYGAGLTIDLGTDGNATILYNKNGFESSESLLVNGNISYTDQLISDVATGTSPLVVASTTKVVNLNVDLLDDQTGSYYLDYNNFTNTPTIGNGALTLNVSGIGLSGSSSFTANQTGASTFTVTSNATSSNTSSTIVSRDSSGNFSAGVITADLIGDVTGNVTGNASSATILETSRSINGVSFDGSSDITVPVNTAQLTTSGSYPVPFVSSVAAGNKQLYTDSAATFYYNPSTNAVGATTFIGALTGIASGVTVTDHTANDTNYPIVWHNNSNALFDTISKLTFNPSTGNLISTSFSGDGSNLTNVDAEKLDGLDSTYFYAASNPSGYTTNVGTITGVTAGTGLSDGGTSGTVTLNHSNSVTAGTASEGGSTRTLAYGGTFNIPSITYDAQGHITAKSSITLTLPSSDDTNYYPTAFTWTNGTTSGPTGSLTGTGMSAVSFGSIPSASATTSGVLTTSTQTIAGLKTFSSGLSVTGNITVSGTVDGRNVATDGDKLDGIASGATANTGTVTSVATGTGLTGGTITDSGTISLSHLGIQSLTDPNADRIMFWDDSAGVMKWLTVSTGLTLSGTTLTNASPNVTTNITTTHAASSVTVNSSDGTNGTINAATTSLAGVMTSTDKTNLDALVNIVEW